MPRKKSKKTADVRIYNDADSRSTTVLATKTDIGSESDMIAGAKRALSECLETDDLYSEVLYDDMYTGNEEGLELARGHARIPALEAKIEWVNRQSERKHEEAERKHEDVVRKLEEVARTFDERYSNLHNAFNELGQQTDVKFYLRYADIRNRFLSTFKRDFMGNESRENQKVIDHGNAAAHHGFFMADATLYDPEGSVDEHGQRIPPRTDRDTFKILYGVDPGLAKKIDYTPTVQVLERHATVRASSRFRITTLFEDQFQAFIRALEAADYAGDYLDVQSDQKELLFAYREFWKAIR